MNLVIIGAMIIVGISAWVMLSLPEPELPCFICHKRDCNGVGGEHFKDYLAE